MKERKKVYAHEWDRKVIIDPVGKWFYELFGWRYVETSCYAKSHGVEKTYLVPDVSGRISVEKGYEDVGDTYDVWHTFERDMNDPKYARYCELERRVCVKVDMWKRYSDVERILESLCPNGVPMNYAEYKHRFVKYYVLGAVTLGILGIFTLLLALGSKGNFVEEFKTSIAEGDSNIIMLFSVLGLTGAAFMTCGIIKHLKSLNKKRLAKEYGEYIFGLLSRRGDPGIVRIIQEAVSLQMED